MTIKNIFNSKISSITGAAIVIGAAYLASKFLGLYRDRLLAGTFGAGDELDIYYAAFRIPDLVYYLVVLGAVSAGLIPVFLDYLHKDKKKAWYLINNLANIMLVILAIVSFGLILIAPWIMKIIVPGFSETKLAMSVQMTQIMFLSPILLGLSAVFGGVVQSFRRFFVFALAPILYNVGIIIGIVFFYKTLGLLGLAWGVVFGALLHLIVQLSATITCGFNWRPVFDLKFAGIKRVFEVMPPRTMALALNQVNILLMTIIASVIGTGSVAFYSLAHNIWSFPLSVFGISFVTASFPRLSEEAQRKNVGEFLKTFSSTARQILFFIVPVSILFIVLRAQIVRVILETGKFLEKDSVIAIDTLYFFLIGLFAEALIWLFLRGFFAWEDAKTPFALGLLSSVVRIGGAWLFAQIYQLGVPGLALGYTIGNIIYLMLLFLALSSKLVKLSKKDYSLIKSIEKKAMATALKIAAAAIVAGFAANRILHLVEPSLKPLFATHPVYWFLIQGGLAGLGGIVAYFLLGWLLKIEEVKLFLAALLKRWPWKKIPREIPEMNGK